MSSKTHHSLGSKSPTIKVTFDHDNIEIGINIKNTVAG